MVSAMSDLPLPSYHQKTSFHQYEILLFGNNGTCLSGLT